MQTELKKAPNPNATILIARIVWVAMLFSVATFYFVAQMDEAAKTAVVPETYAEIFSNQMIQIIFLQAIVIAGAAFFLPKIVGRRGQTGSKLQKGFVALVVRLALSEAVAIFGLVSYFMIHTSKVMHPFLAISVLLILISFPTQELLEDFAS